MVLHLEQKKAIVTELLNITRQAISVVVADYRGLTVLEISELRKAARSSIGGVTMRVYRNTLARRAFKKTPYACLNKFLTGPTILFFSRDEPGAAARLIENFIKKHEQLKVKALALGGKLLSADKLKACSQLPSRKEALSQLAIVLLASVTKFARTIHEPVVQIIRLIVAIQDQKKAV
ncbi:MAG: 50S ribosomal protein L10 [Coxiella endosymbiont of Dermacentor silvarum]